MRNSLTKSISLLAIAFSWQLQGATVAEITQFTDSGNSRTVHVATDNKDNFIAVFQDETNAFGTYSPLGTEWIQPYVQLNTIGTFVNGGPDVAMDETSTGLAIWTQSAPGLFSVQSSFFNNGVWTLVAPPIETSAVNSFAYPTLAMNGTGKALAVWVNADLEEVHASFFNAGVWSPFQNLGVGSISPDVAYNLNGQAVVGFYDSGINSAATYNGTTWQPAIVLDNQANDAPKVGIDANGNAIAIWLGGAFSQNIQVSRFNGVSWSAPLTLSPAGGNISPDLAVFKDGTAIAVWVDNNNTIQMSRFNGTTWSSLTPIAQGKVVAITLDSKENALIAWGTVADQLFTALLPKGGTLQTPVFITQGIFELDPALSSLSTLGSIVWIDSGIESSPNSFGTFIAFGPTSPTNLLGATCHTGSERVNVIAWTPSTDPTVVSYRVFRDSVLIAIVPATGPFVFYDHNRCRGVTTTYSVIALNADGIESAPVTVTITN